MDNWPFKIQFIRSILTSIYSPHSLCKNCNLELGVPFCPSKDETLTETAQGYVLKEKKQETSS